VLGAVKSPDAEMVPPVAVQVTDVFDEPLTVAANCCVAFVNSDAELGVSEIETGAVPVTVAVANFVVSATLVALTV
jgi:hypothetical protein